MKTTTSLVMAAAGIGLLGMWGASAGPADGVSIEKAIMTKWAPPLDARRHIARERRGECLASNAVDVDACLLAQREPHPNTRLR
jgi:hypothetical protein